MLRSGIIAKKVGMTRLFMEDGKQIPVTVLQLDGLQVIAQRTADAHGYSAVQLGAGTAKAKRTSQAMRGHFAAAKVEPKRKVAEFRVDPDEVSDLKVGDSLNVTHFTPGDKIDVTGTSKGRGYQGVIKRHGFKGAKEMTHGTHEYKRHSGSIGCSAYPARVIKGKKMAGQMGNTRITVPGLTVVAIHANENVLLVKGAVPGAKNSLVTVAPSV